MAKDGLQRRVKAVRRFNRFYTKRLNLLDEAFLGSPFSLAEARVLYELAHNESISASEIGAQLGLDAGYLSRMLRGMKDRGLVAKGRCKEDGRRSMLRMTERGWAAFAELDARSGHDIGTMLGTLPVAEQLRLVRAMRTIEGALGAERVGEAPFILRAHRPGDMGWVVQRHGALYFEEHGWDERFEGLVAGLVSRFIEARDPKRERCWIAEMDGEPAGCAFLVGESAKVARLRMLLVEPWARGLGIGTRLVEECLRFARRAGYRKVKLWTVRGLMAAQRLYEREGFRLVHEEPLHDYGRDLTSETWELEL